MEQEPNTSSRVTLDNSRDRLGIRRAKVDWRLGRLEHKTLDKNKEIIVACLSRLGFDCSVENKQFASSKKEFEESPRWVWHHMGTTRMSTNSKQAVVDSNCRVHSMSNLYIAGSSVFPTGGNDMPTLTIVALAHRIADHLKLQLERSALRIDEEHETARSSAKMAEFEPLLHLPIGLLRKANRPRLGNALQARRDIDPIAH
jgi:choline dehydrogenase-like flavoprotein